MSAGSGQHRKFTPALKITYMTLPHLKLWGAFAGASCLTFLVYKTQWSTDWYLAYLALLGVLSILLAARLLVQPGENGWPEAGVVTGLLIGQWWLVQRLINRLFFYFAGFAP